MQTTRPRPTYYTRLQFIDASRCVEWLESLPLGDAAAAHEMVSAQLELLTRSDAVSAIERLRILEVLQRPIASLQRDFALRFAGKPLPLSIVDYAVWNSTIELWQTLFCAYHDAFAASRAGEASLVRHAPLLALRSLECTGASMREHQRAYRAVPAGLWKQLHCVFSEAEDCGFVGRTLDDPVGTSGATRSCTAAYVQALLADHANPYTLSAKQMGFMLRWLELWAPLARVGAEPPADATTALAVDLGRAQGAIAASAAQRGASVRFLDLDQLSRSVRRTLAALQQGRTPAELGLGEDCRQPGTEGLIGLLHATWFGPTLRAGTRQGATGEPVTTCIGFRAVHHQLADGSSRDSGRTDALHTASTGAWSPALERWQLLHAGQRRLLELARGGDCEGRVQHHQLVGLRVRTSPGIRIGVLQELRIEETGDLLMMVRELTSAARAIEIRRKGERAAEGAMRRALWVPESPDAPVPATLLIEPGFFATNTPIEVVTVNMGAFRLTRLVEQGVDFDRVAIEPCL